MTGRKAVYAFWAIVLGLFFMTVSLVEGSVPREEHPRPDGYRDLWLSLNGEWNFAMDPQNVGEQEQWFIPGKQPWPERIVVPFPWESKLSKIGRTDYKGSAWYQRRFILPDAWKNRQVYLNFGAVDWSAKIWVNGKLVGEHEGGYTPFSVALTDALGDKTEHILTVKATDTTDSEHPTGKQIGWYTTTSGIWQTVYLEARGEGTNPSIQDILFKPHIDGFVEIAVQPSQAAPAGLSIRILPDTPPDNAGPTETIEEAWVKPAEAGKPMQRSLQIPSPKLWSPDSPVLYFVRVRLLVGDKAVDTVHTYFGIREVSRGKYGDHPYESVLLNGKPFYILGALDQAFHPDGIYAYPSDQIIRGDVEDAKKFGFNNLRLHIKVDEPRFYYWADRLGLTILYDLPSFHKYTDEAKRAYELTLRQAIARDQNHPSILAWVLFNETWGLQQQKTPEGQAWVKQMFQLAKSLDPTRLVEDNSPCSYDHIITDLNSWHFYIYSHDKAREHIEQVVKKTAPGSEFNYIGGNKQGTVPLINSEYGGVSAGMGDRDISWCFHYLTQELRRHPKIGGYIYTELQDIEWEHNGFMNYNRSKKVFGYEDFVPVPKGQEPFSYRDLNAPDFLILDAIAGENLSGVSQKSVPTALALYSGHAGGNFTIIWQLHESTQFEPQWRPVVEGRGALAAQPYTVNPGEPITFKVEPDRLYLLYAWAVDADGKTAARNFWMFHSFKNDPPMVEKEAGKVYVRWNPTKYASLKGIPEAPRCQRPDILSVTGEASVTYAVRLPDDLDLSRVKKATLRCELSACAGKERVDWKQRVRVPGTPQTDADNPYPSTVVVYVNDTPLPEIVLSNDPGDYRGILSNIFDSAPPSSYGYLQTVEVPIAAFKNQREVEITFSTKPNTSGGIRIFGARSGRYPVDPVLIFE